MITLLTSASVGNASSVYFVAFITMPVHWIPVLNPVITIIVVRSYRRVVFRKFLSKRVATVRSATNGYNAPS
ncbi:hypothetical protein DdX_21288 [Ditylenchus destructor]|uniref:Uncharacterized protein n=1 Tax=Ditylenchus destructor TaxID=166010 RepID=A0AAD4MJC1_9BILA|nr:hypothetical protein DdX_21288 [Ditylenchus destructor]